MAQRSPSFDNQHETTRSHSEQGRSKEGNSSRLPVRSSIRADNKNSFFLLASIGLVIAGLYFAQSVVIPIALAMLLAFLLAPSVNRVEKLHVPRVLATIIVVAIVLAFVASMAWTMERQFTEVAARLPQYRVSIHDKIADFLKSGRVFERASEELHRTVRDISATTQESYAEPPAQVQVVSGPESPITLMLDYAGSIAGRLLSVAIVMVFVIFILIWRDDLRERMIQLLGEGHLSRTTEAMDEAAQRVSRYLMAQSMINCSFGAAVAIGICVIDWSLGGDGSRMPSAILAGTLCAMFRFVPYVGVWIAAALPLTIAFAVFPGNGVFFATLLLFVGLEITISEFVEPRWLGSSTGLSPLAILVAALFWTWLWGPIGLLLSTPLTVLLVLMGKYVPQLEFLDVLLSEKSTLEPPMRIYHRLLAGDDEIAIEIAGEYLKEWPLEKVYDQVLLPAMAAAQRDWHQGRLSDQQHDFIGQAMREIIDFLAEQSAAQSVTETKPETQMQALPTGSDLRVLCIPAQDEADEIVGMMLHHLLKSLGYRSTVVSAAALASEMVEASVEQDADAVIISALPPRAAIHVRYLIKRLAAGRPDVIIVAGLWTDSHVAKSGYAGAGLARPVSQLHQAMAEIEQMSHQALINSK